MHHFHDLPRRNMKRSEYSECVNHTTIMQSISTLLLLVLIAVVLVVVVAKLMKVFIKLNNKLINWYNTRNNFHPTPDQQLEQGLFAIVIAGIVILTILLTLMSMFGKLNIITH